LDGRGQKEGKEGTKIRTPNVEGIGEVPLIGKEGGLRIGAIHPGGKGGYILRGIVGENAGNS